MTDFPTHYLESFYRMLMDPSNNIEVLTYSDLEFGNDDDFHNNYPLEKEIWLESLSNGERDPEKIYVFIQHDIDNAPERTNEMLVFQKKIGLRSNVMLFNKPVKRGLLQNKGILEFDDYDVDLQLFLELQDLGWVFGYHSNCYERSHFNATEAERIFIEDVIELRSNGLKIDFFCPHGGVRDSNGITNNSIETPISLRSELKWVLNKHTIRFDGSFSDGGFKSRDNWDNLDLRKFVDTWVPGRRYRMLFHPQYYGGDPFSPFEPMLDSDWYRDLVQTPESHFQEWWENPPPDTPMPDDFQKLLDWSSMNTSALKKELRMRKLPASGRKAELVQRLNEAQSARFHLLRKDGDVQISVNDKGGLLIDSCESNATSHTVLVCRPEFLRRENFHVFESSNQLIFDIDWRVIENKSGPATPKIILEYCGKGGALLDRNYRVFNPIKIGRLSKERIPIELNFTEETQFVRIKIYLSKEQRSIILIEKLMMHNPTMSFEYSL